MPRAVIALALLASASLVRADLPPQRLFGQLPTISGIELSPDGTRWAAVVGDEKSTQIQVRATKGNELLSVTPAEKFKVRNVMWVGNDHVVATLSATSRSACSDNQPVDSVYLVGLDLAKDCK